MITSNYFLDDFTYRLFDCTNVNRSHEVALSSWSPKLIYCLTLLPLNESFPSLFDRTFRETLSWMCCKGQVLTRE